MKYLLFVLVCMLCAIAHAQRLYVNDIDNGSYRSYDIGDKIEFTVSDSASVFSGVITSLQHDGFTLNDSVKVKIAQITALVKPGGGKYSVGRVLLIILGSYLLLSGTVYTIAGAALVALPMRAESVGVVVLLLGAGMAGGGYAIIHKQVKKARSKTIIRQPMDNIHYRLFIE
jgi:hypothetical protein